MNKIKKNSQECFKKKFHQENVYKIIQIISENGFYFVNLVFEDNYEFWLLLNLKFAKKFDLDKFSDDPDYVSKRTKAFGKTQYSKSKVRMRHSETIILKNIKALASMTYRSKPLFGVCGLCGFDED